MEHRILVEQAPDIDALAFEAFRAWLAGFGDR
jgi:hypothetical protein